MLSVLYHTVVLLSIFSCLDIATCICVSAVISLGGTNVKWIKVNVNQTGYYRVNYTMDMWRSLSHQLQQNHLVHIHTCL